MTVECPENCDLWAKNLLCFSAKHIAQKTAGTGNEESFEIGGHVERKIVGAVRTK